LGNSRWSRIRQKLDGQGRIPKLHDVPRLERRYFDWNAVDPRAIGAAIIQDVEHALLDRNRGMHSGHEQVWQNDLVRRVPAYSGLGLDPVLFAQTPAQHIRHRCLLVERAGRPERRRTRQLNDATRKL
jgi:hypothetical protein